MTQKKFLERVRVVTIKDQQLGHGIDDLLRNTVEEMGEFAAAYTVEQGLKKKKLKESSKEEAVDLIICALSLFYARGGTDSELTKIGQRKLKKWQNRVEQFLLANKKVRTKK